MRGEKENTDSREKGEKGKIQRGERRLYSSQKKCVTVDNPLVETKSQSTSPMGHEKRKTINKMGGKSLTKAKGSFLNAGGGE